ncbi:MAG: proton-conducting transporter membrane subunit, partial [Verrucomicrobiota bacterium]
MDDSTLAWMVLLLPLVVAASILLGLKKWSGLSALLSTGSALITLVFCAILAGKESVEATSFTWIHLTDSPEKDFKVNIGFELDALSRGMMLIVTSIGFLVHLFSLAYMKDDDGKWRYFAGLSLFMFSMTGIVLADNFVMMFIFWELVGVSSYILIGHWFHKESAADAAKKAFLTNKIGDFGFMIGILLVWVLTGSIFFDEIEKAVGGVTNAVLLNIAVLCVFCGAIGKSAQLPLHVWLPDAMEGPTPVSALIHAATMVAAGVFMLARVVFLIESAETAAHVIAWVGAITALVAALMALQQSDIKRILAYSTLSQLGYMVMSQGIGHGGSDAGMFHLYTHAFFK